MPGRPGGGGRPGRGLPAQLQGVLEAHGRRLCPLQQTWVGTHNGCLTWDRLNSEDTFAVCFMDNRHYEDGTKTKVDCNGWWVKQQTSTRSFKLEVLALSSKVFNQKCFTWLISLSQCLRLRKVGLHVGLVPRRRGRSQSQRRGDIFLWRHGQLGGGLNKLLENPSLVVTKIHFVE